MVLAGKSDIVQLVLLFLPRILHIHIVVLTLKGFFALVADRLRLRFLDNLLLLGQLVLNLLDLILQDLELALLVLKFLRVDIHLVLKALGFAFMHRVVPAAHAAPSN